jgi:hypothetical protein
MKKTVSLCWPWNFSGSRWSFDRTIEELVALMPDSVALRAFDGPFEYGGLLQTRIPWKGKTYRDLEVALKALPHRIEVDLWGPIYTRLWEAEARLQKNVILPYYNPEHEFVDVEGETAAKYLPTGLGPFLRSMGRPKRTKLWLQSYRRADAHQDMLFAKWLSYKDQATGEYVIHGLSPQLYPMGWKTPQQYQDQTELDVASYEKIAARVGRPDIRWFPTLPTFIDQGWTASVAGVQRQVEWLLANLGDRMDGINFWSVDQNMWEIPGMSEYVANLHLPGSTQPLPVSVETPAPVTLELVDRRVTALEIIHQPGAPHP